MLSNKAGLVTGGADGIGRAASLAYAREGAAGSQTFWLARDRKSDWHLEGRIRSRRSGQLAA